MTSGSGVTRLAATSAELAARLDDQPEPVLRRIAVQAARSAIEATGLLDPRVDRALSAVEAAKWGDSPERAAVWELAAELDERSWLGMEKGDDPQDARHTPESERFWTQHLAANSLAFALESDARTACFEAVYEAGSAVELDDDELLGSA
jgi:hypothetical protein